MGGRGSGSGFRAGGSNPQAASAPTATADEAGLTPAQRTQAANAESRHDALVQALKDHQREMKDLKWEIMAMPSRTRAQKAAIDAKQRVYDGMIRQEQQLVVQLAAIRNNAKAAGLIETRRETSMQTTGPATGALVERYVDYWKHNGKKVAGAAD